MKARLISVLLVLALLVTVGVIAAQAETTTADRNAIAATYPTLAEVQAVNTGYCPFCGTTGNTWQELPAVTGTSLALTTGHYYAASDLKDNTGYYSVAGGNTVCVHLNGKTIQSSGQAFRSTYSNSAKATLTIMGSGTVIGGSTSTDASVIRSTSNVNLIGGTYKHTSGTALPSVWHGAATTRGATCFYNGTVLDADEGVYGPNAHISYGNMVMYGGEIKNAQNDPSSTGIKKFGGNVWVVSGHASVTAKFIMEGGSIHSGTAHHGGNVGLYVNKGGDTEFVQNGGSVYNGTAREGGNGGNIYAVSGGSTVTIKGTVYGGTAPGNGGNIACVNSAVLNIQAGANIYNTDVAEADANVNMGGSSTLDITGGTVDGGINFASTGTLNISGAPTINATNGGVNLGSGKVITVGEMATGASVKVTAAAADTAVTAAFADADAATAALAYFGAANAEEYMLQVNTTAATLEYVEVPPAGVCPICGEEADVIELSEANAGTLSAGHYKLTAALELDGALIVADDVCVNLNGFNVTSSGLVIDQTGGTLNIGGNGTVTGASAADTSAATIQVTGGTLNLKGGEYKHTSASTLPTLYIGGTGNAETDVTHTLENVKLTADTGVTGTNLSATTCKIEVRDSIIENGIAPSTSRGGGNIYAINANINFFNSIIRNGTAADATRGGGNIYTETGALKYSNSQVLSVMPADITEETAYTAKEGGSIYHRSGTQTFYDSSVISGGYAEENGGSVFVFAGTFNLVSGTFTGGQAVRGAFLAQIPTSAMADKSDVNVYGGTYNEGKLPETGADRGKTFMVRGGKLTLTGGTFNSTSKGTSGKETGCAINIASVGVKATLVLTESTVSAYKAPEIVINDAYPGNAIRVGSSGDAHVEVTSRFNDDISIRLEGVTYGETLEKGAYTAVDGVEYTGSVAVSYLNGAPLLLHDGNGGLVVAGAQADGEWTTTADAFANATESIKLYEDEATVEITESPADIDLNGKSITINGTGVVNATNSKATAASTVTLNGPTLAQTETAVWNTDHFDVVLGENGVYTVHRLEMRIKSISLRPTTAGLYYTSEIVMDDVLKEQVDEIGVVLAVGDGTVDLSDPASENVKFVGTNEIGSTVNSVLVNNILKVGAENNADRAAWKVQGAAAVIFKGDLGEAVATAENYAQSRSVNDYMELANSKFADLSDDNKLGLQNFYNTWKSVTGWSYADIESWVAPTPEA